MAALGPVVFVSYSGLWGGAERALLDVIVGLEAPAVLVCPNGPLAERARGAGVPVLLRPARALSLRGGLGALARAALRLLAHAAEVRAVVRAARPRAVVAWNMRSALACAVALRTIGGRRQRPPLIFQHSDLLPSGPAAHVVRVAARAADCVIAMSATIARDLDPGGRCRCLFVVHPGVDLDAYAATPLPPGPPQVLLLGAIVSWKRPDLALEAVALAAGSYRRCGSWWPATRWASPAMSCSAPCAAGPPSPTWPVGSTSSAPSMIRRRLSPEHGASCTVRTGSRSAS